MTRRIMNRLRNHPEIKVSLVVGLFLMVPAWTEAAKISSSDTTHSLREEARASSAPLSIGA